MNFYEKYYIEFRALLVRYGLRFHRSVEVAEDLFEECHLAVCWKYESLEAEDYLKIMKTSIKNKFRNLKWGLATDVNLWQDSSLHALSDVVIQKEEIKKMLLALKLLPQRDQDLLLHKTIDGRRLFEAKQKLRRHLDQKEVQ
jgi:DNA-directed RNA polymerase specialized sigma24 family protein